LQAALTSIEGENMLRTLTVALALAAAPAAAGPKLELSGPIKRLAAEPAPSALPLIGIVADAQIQTREQNVDVEWYRSRRIDSAPSGDVAIRPPALDWSARYMLEGYLHRLVAGGAKAIFFLGDGANHGCYDEFLRGLDPRKPGTSPKPNERGILRLLDDFRRSTDIPVYFVIGNHDFMGAGSTTQVGFRERLCDDFPDRAEANRVLSRFEVIEAIDAFNRGNSGLRTGFKPDYVSNVAAGLREKCLLGAEAPTEDELRRQGCYYAAALNYPGDSEPLAQFLLLDTTDNADVSGSSVGRLQVESLRGAMSFRDRENSQTAFLRRRATALGRVPLRLAFTHYPVKALTKWNMLNLGGYSQRFLDLFVDPDDGRPLQDDAFVLSGHTHASANPRRNRFKSHGGTRIGELNVGSTTDSSEGPDKRAKPPHAALVGFRPPAVPGQRTTLEYKVVELPAEDCAPVYEALDAAGWDSFGLDERNPKNYQYFDRDRKLAIFAALQRFVGETPSPEGALKARCIGLRASELEGPAYRRPSR
jgi:hypothetical protein